VRGYLVRLLIDALFCFLAEIGHAAYTKALIAGMLPEATALSLLLPLTGFLGGLWFVTEKSARKRFGYVLAGAVGYSLGTACVMALWP
jgi:hypothetical protein